MSDTFPKIKEIVLDKLKFQVSQMVSEHLLADVSNLQFDCHVDMITRGLVMQVKMFLAGRTVKEVEVKYPKTWWDAVKERFAPKWVTQHYPIEYVQVKLTAQEIYPLLSMPREKHLVFLEANYD